MTSALRQPRRRHAVDDARSGPSQHLARPKVPFMDPVGEPFAVALEMALVEDVLGGLASVEGVFAPRVG